MFEAQGVKVCVDQVTLDMIDGATIDFKDEMIRSAFEVVDNPKAEMSCGCGTSFAPKSDSFL